MGFASLNPSYEAKMAVGHPRTQARRPTAGNGRLRFSSLSPAKKFIAAAAKVWRLTGGPTTCSPASRNGARRAVSSARNRASVYAW
jgi:hypothetical protein